MAGGGAAVPRSFERGAREHATDWSAAFQAHTLAERLTGLPEVSLQHVQALTDDTGLLQHATFCVPRYSEGYCIDDNARALLLMARIEEAGTEDRDRVRALATRYLAFVHAAFNPARGRFRNFLSYSRTWTEQAGSEDSHGRGLHALGAVVGRSSDPGTHEPGGRALPRRAARRRAASAARAPGRRRCSASTSTSTPSKAIAGCRSCARSSRIVCSISNAARTRRRGRGSRTGSPTRTRSCRTR